MKTQEYLAQLNTGRSPKVIYLYGTTAVGKSTFAEKLRKEFSYVLVDLDQMIQNEIVEKYNLEPGDTFKRVNRGEGKEVWMEHYLRQAQQAINSAGSRVVVECPIKHPPTVHKILDPHSGDYEFLFLFPDSKDIYLQRLTQRIMRHRDGKFGLPKTFWSEVSESDKEAFFRDFTITAPIEGAIGEYADRQIARSRELLHILQKTFYVQVLSI